jgi:hypothetical protein
MKVLVKILVGLGIAFAAILALIVVVVVLQSAFKEEHEPFVRSFVADYSAHWEIAQVRDRVSNDLLLQIQSPNGARAVAGFKRLGRLKEITDLTLQNFFAGTSQSTGTFTFKAEFENAPAVVSLQLQVSDGHARVNGLHINPLSEPPLLGSEKADI